MFTILFHAFIHLAPTRATQLDLSQAMTDENVRGRLPVLVGRDTTKMRWDQVSLQYAGPCKCLVRTPTVCLQFCSSSNPFNIISSSRHSPLLLQLLTSLRHQLPPKSLAQLQILPQALNDREERSNRPKLVIEETESDLLFSLAIDHAPDNEEADLEETLHALSHVEEGGDL
jgi:hypothetical protein